MHVLQTTRVFDGHFKVTQLLLQDGPAQLRRERFEPGHAVAALVFDTARQRYLLARQYRIGPEQEITELAAGMIDAPETAETAIRREILEELGYAVDRLTPIVTLWPSPGTSAETIAVFYAEVSRQTAPGGGLASENERIETVAFTWEALLAEPWRDAKTLVAVQWVRLRG